MAKTGFSYFCTDTDRYQDRKIKRLKKRCGCVGMCIYDYIICEVFRVRGYMLEWDADTIFDIAEYFGIEEAQVSEAVEYMAEVGLFDAAKLAEGIITSASIQRRFYEMSDKAKRKGVTIPDEVCVLFAEVTENAESGNSTTIPEETAEIPENSEKFGNNSEETAETPEVSAQRKEKKNKINSLSVSLSLSDGAEIESDTPSEEVAEVSATDREKIFEILFFEKNAKKPEAETNALIGYYTANGWKRSQGAKIRERSAVASTWTPSDPAPRLHPKLLDWLREVHQAAKHNNPADASAIIHGIVAAEFKFKDGRNIFDIILKPSAREALLRYCNNVPRPSFSINLRNG